MKKEVAKKILSESISNLHKRNGGIILPNVEEEVISHACAVVLTNNKKHDAIFIDQVALAFTEAAKEFFPGDYTDVAITGIHQNVAWEGMWNHLRKYFIEKHGVDIEQ